MPGDVTLPIRKIDWACNPGYDTEADVRYVYGTTQITYSETALILMDVWGTHLLDGWAERAYVVTVEKIAPVLAWARSKGLTIIHTPHLQGNPYGYFIHPAAAPIEGEYVIDGLPEDERTALSNILRNRGIRKIIYVGYSSNMCLLMRPTGFAQTCEWGYKLITVRDASIAAEMTVVWPMGTIHDVMVSVYETFGVSTTVEELVSQ
jgi:nicotinamidase-related amidase